MGIMLDNTLRAKLASIGELQSYYKKSDKDTFFYRNEIEDSIEYVKDKVGELKEEGEIERLVSPFNGKDKDIMRWVTKTGRKLRKEQNG